MLVTLCAKATNRQQVKVYDDPGKIGSVKFANRLESCCLARDDTQTMPPRLLVLQRATAFATVISWRVPHTVSLSASASAAGSLF